MGNGKWEMYNTAINSDFAEGCQGQTRAIVPKMMTDGIIMPMTRLSKSYCFFSFSGEPPIEQTNWSALTKI
ncbi:hypothetical protein C0J52_09075 [Blattella germanica]|nr:hypothetical protein C0J52_09075 [Blattella germanica]